jgi:hypothetical protein
MERCFEFRKGKESGKDKERDEKKREESACFPDMGMKADFPQFFPPKQASSPCKSKWDC